MSLLVHTIVGAVCFAAFVGVAWLIGRLAKPEWGDTAMNRIIGGSLAIFIFVFLLAIFSMLGSAVMGALK